MENKNSVNIVLVVLIVILSTGLGLLGGYLIYDKIVDRDNTVNNDNNISDNENDEINPENVKVSTYIEKKVNLGTCVCDGSKNELNISLPQIDSNSKNAKNINEKIKNDYKDEINDAVNPDDYQSDIFTDGPREISYTYQKTNDVIYIMIKQTGGWCATGYTLFSGYIYDIKNDKLLTNEDVLNKINMSQEDFNNKISKAVAEKNGVSLEETKEALIEYSLSDYTLILNEKKLLVYINGSGGGMFDFGEFEISL